MKDDLLHKEYSLTLGLRSLHLACQSSHLTPLERLPALLLLVGYPKCAKVALCWGGPFQNLHQSLLRVSLRKPTQFLPAHHIKSPRHRFDLSTETPCPVQNESQCS